MSVLQLSCLFARVITLKWRDGPELNPDAQRLGAVIAVIAIVALCDGSELNPVTQQGRDLLQLGVLSDLITQHVSKIELNSDVVTLQSTY